jgi:site-specific recombinase XerD
MRIILTIKLRDLGLDIKDRQALLAHVSSNTTKIYTHPNLELAKKPINKL